MAVRFKLGAMGVLLGIAIFCAFAIGHAWQWLVCLALAFSWLGDALLARVDALVRRVHDPFIAGMGAFALAQITYIIAFWKSIAAMPAMHMPVPGAYTGLQVLPAMLPVYILAGALFWVWTILRTSQDWDIKIATLVYCLLLSTMGAFATAAAFTGTLIAWPLIVGGILFMASDCIIAAHVFGGRLDNERHYEIAVWATYLPAQIMLLLGTSWLY